MSIDAVAILHLSSAPLADWEDEPNADVREDCVLVSLLMKFHPHALSDYVRALSASYGPALERHLDPRGVLFFPDVAEPRGRTYSEVVAQVADVGFWKSLAPLESWETPEAPPDSPAGVIHQIGQQHGGAAADLAEELQVYYFTQRAGGTPESIAEYQARHAALAALLSAALLQDLEAALDNAYRKAFRVATSFR